MLLRTTTCTLLERKSLPSALNMQNGTKKKKPTRKHGNVSISFKHYVATHVPGAESHRHESPKVSRDIQTLLVGVGLLM